MTQMFFNPLTGRELGTWRFTDIYREYYEHFLSNFITEKVALSIFSKLRGYEVKTDDVIYLEHDERGYIDIVSKIIGVYNGIYSIDET